MDEGQNYTTFSSRGLLDMIGDLNDKALEASRMKDFMGTWRSFLQLGSAKSLFPLHLGIKCCALEMARWALDSMRRVLVWYSEVAQTMRCLLVNGPSPRSSQTPLSVYGSKCLNQVVHCNGDAQFLAALFPILQHP